MGDTPTTQAAKGPRFLLLEDEPLLAELFEMCIRDWFKDPEILKFANGDEALRSLEQSGPDMLIMDWTHPGLNGQELLERLSKRQPRFVILLTSGMFSTELRPAASRDLKVGFLPKPFGVLQFWHALNEFIGPSDFPERQEQLARQELH